VEQKVLNDRSIIAAQLRRSPRGEFTVSTRCLYGYPQVIRVHPVVAGKPFPTLYWLTCPFLSKEIGHLEAAGWVKRLENRMAEEDDLRIAMYEAHRRTCEQRDGLLSSDDRDALTEAGMLVEFHRRGIGGISDWDRLKCLHLHAAHALADENAVGTIILRMVPSLECPPQQLICSAYK